MLDERKEEAFCTILREELQLATGCTEPIAVAYCAARLRQVLGQALETLSPEHRQVLLLRELQGLSYEEISDVLELDLGTVKSRIARAREKMRKYLLRNGNFSAYAPSNVTERAGKEGQP